MSLIEYDELLEVERNVNAPSGSSAIVSMSRV